ncbi:MAG: Rossmann-fold NAD(P)-binding domain-containing protein, partial [Planctomycetota bacterium]
EGGMEAMPEHVSRIEAAREAEAFPGARPAPTDETLRKFFSAHPTFEDVPGLAVGDPAYAVRQLFRVFEPAELYYTMPFPKEAVAVPEAEQIPSDQLPEYEASLADVVRAGGEELAYLFPGGFSPEAPWQGYDLNPEFAGKIAEEAVRYGVLYPQYARAITYGMWRLARAGQLAYARWKWQPHKAAYEETAQFFRNMDRVQARRWAMEQEMERFVREGDIGNAERMARWYERQYGERYKADPRGEAPDITTEPKVDPVTETVEVDPLPPSLSKDDLPLVRSMYKAGDLDTGAIEALKAQNSALAFDLDDIINEQLIDQLATTGEMPGEVIEDAEGIGEEIEGAGEEIISEVGETPEEIRLRSAEKDRLEAEAGEAEVEEGPRVELQPEITEVQDAFVGIGRERLEKAGVIQPGETLTDWFDKFFTREKKDIWQGGRKIRGTTIEELSKKELWGPTPESERLRKAMLALYRAAKKTGWNPEWLVDQTLEEGVGVEEPEVIDLGEMEFHGTTLDSASNQMNDYLLDNIDEAKLEEITGDVVTDRVMMDGVGEYRGKMVYLLKDGKYYTVADNFDDPNKSGLDWRQWLVPLRKNAKIDFYKEFEALGAPAAEPGELPPGVEEEIISEEPIRVTEPEIDEVMKELPKPRNYDELVSNLSDRYKSMIEAYQKANPTLATVEWVNEIKRQLDPYGQSLHDLNDEMRDIISEYELTDLEAPANELYAKSDDMKPDIKLYAGEDEPDWFWEITEKDPWIMADALVEIDGKEYLAQDDRSEVVPAFTDRAGRKVKAKETRVQDFIPVKEGEKITLDAKEVWEQLRLPGGVKPVGEQLELKPKTEQQLSYEEYRRKKAKEAGMTVEELQDLEDLELDALVGEHDPGATAAEQAKLLERIEKKRKAYADLPKHWNVVDTGYGQYDTVEHILQTIKGFRKDKQNTARLHASMWWALNAARLKTYPKEIQEAFIEKFNKITVGQKVSMADIEAGGPTQNQWGSDWEPYAEQQREAHISEAGRMRGEAAPPKWIPTTRPEKERIEGSFRREVSVYKDLMRDKDYPKKPERERLEITKDHKYVYHSGNRPISHLLIDRDIPGVKISESGRYIFSKEPVSMEQIYRWELTAVGKETRGALALDYYRSVHPDAKGVELYKDMGEDKGWQGVVIAESTKEPGRWQMTTFDERGFIGDSSYKTEIEAVGEALFDGFINPMPGLLDDAAADPQFLEGIEAVEKAQKEHAERMKKVAEEKPSGTPLKDIKVQARAIREKTGEIIKVEKDAETALRDVDEITSVYQQLLECLKS